jgi:hypothetical protein
MKKKKQQTKKVTARDWGVVSLIARSGGKGAHRSKKRPPRTTAKAALKKSLMRNDSHEAFFLCSFRWRQKSMLDI